MADFTPFRTPTGFSPTINDGGRGRKLVVPIRAPARPLRAFPDHGAGQSGPQPRKARPAPRGEVLEEKEEPKGPTQAEIDAMIAAAREEARAAAQRELQGERQEMERRLAKAQEFIAALESQSRGWAREMRSEVGGLVVAVVERLVGEVPEFVGGMLTERCGEIAEKMAEARRVSIHVHPDAGDHTAELGGDRVGWEIGGDDSIRGGCVARTSSGEFDGTLDTALEALSAAISGWSETMDGDAEEDGG